MSEIDQFVCFSLSFARDFVKNIARKLVNRIGYHIGMFRRESKFAKGVLNRWWIWTGVPYPQADFDRGVKIRKGGAKSTMTLAFLSGSAPKTCRFLVMTICKALRTCVWLHQICLRWQILVAVNSITTNDISHKLVFLKHEIQHSLDSNKKGGLFHFSDIYIWTVRDTSSIQRQGVIVNKVSRCS